MYPKGPGFGWDTSWPERDACVILWKDFLERGAPEDIQGLPYDARIKMLLLAAQKVEASGQPLAALALYLDIRALFDTPGVQISGQDRGKIEKGISLGTREEARFIATQLYSSKEEIEECLAQPADYYLHLETVTVGDRINFNVKGTLADSLYRGRGPDDRLSNPSLSLSQKRFNTEGAYLDPWGSPYQVLHPGRASSSWVEVLSWGSNQKDDGGQGDDVPVQAP
jgi:hypothetical protein